MDVGGHQRHQRKRAARAQRPAGPRGDRPDVLADRGFSGRRALTCEEAGMVPLRAQAANLGRHSQTPLRQAGFRLFVQRGRLSLPSEMAADLAVRRRKWHDAAGQMVEHPFGTIKAWMSSIRIPNQEPEVDQHGDEPAGPGLKHEAGHRDCGRWAAAASHQGLRSLTYAQESPFRTASADRSTLAR